MTPPPGFYKTNYRALRLREIVRWYGWRRGLRFYLRTRTMPPSGGTWFPGLWSETECPREDLSEQFWQATKPHRKDFEQLGFTECGFLKIGSLTLKPSVRDSGGIRYLDPTRRIFGQLIYHRIRRASRSETSEITIAFTAVFDDGTSFSCTNRKKTFDPLKESDVIRFDSYDVPFIYQQFQQGLQNRKKTPRAFPDLESLRHWYDARQQKAFEERVRRRLFLPMTEQEIAAARARLTGGPPASRKRRPVPISIFVWLFIIAAIFLLEQARHHALPARSRADTMEFRGQQFKMRKAYETYEDYKDDPNNLDTNELDRIEQVMTGAEVPRTFKDRKTFIEFVVFKLTFPGYGASSMGGPTDDGSTLDFESVEIPQRDKDRVLVARDAGGELKLIDDFVYSTATNDISSLKLEKGTLRYYDHKGQLIREKPL